MMDQPAETPNSSTTPHFAKIHSINTQMERLVPVSEFCAEHRLVANTTAYLRCKHLNKWSKYLTEKAGFRKLGFTSWPRLSTHHVRLDNEVTKRLYTDRRIKRANKTSDDDEIQIRRTYPDMHPHLSRRYLTFRSEKSCLSQDVTQNVISNVIYNSELHKWTPEMVVLFESPPTGPGRGLKHKREVIMREPAWFIWSEQMCEQFKLLNLLSLNFNDPEDKAQMYTYHGENSYEAKALRHIRKVVKLREIEQGEKDYQRVQRMQKSEECADAVPLAGASCTNTAKSEMPSSKDATDTQGRRDKELQPEGEDDAVDDFSQPPRKRRCREGIHRDLIILFPYTNILPNEEDAEYWRYLWSFFIKSQAYFDRVASFIPADVIKTLPPLLEPTTCTCAWETFRQRAAKIDALGRVIDPHSKRDPFEDESLPVDENEPEETQTYTKEELARQSQPEQTDEHAQCEAQTTDGVPPAITVTSAAQSKPIRALKSALACVSSPTKILKPYALWTSEESDISLASESTLIKQAKKILDESDANIGKLLRNEARPDVEKSSV